MKLGNDDMSILTRSSCTELLYLALAVRIRTLGFLLRKT